MPNSVSLTAWLFDPAFQYYGDLAIGSNYTEFATTYQQTFNPINLGDRLVPVEITDLNDDEIIQGGDTFIYAGHTYTVTYVYNGDIVVIGGTNYTVVTIYGDSSTQGGASISFPVVDGKAIFAFDAVTSETIWLKVPVPFNLPISQLPCFLRGTLIETTRGPCPVEQLTIADEILTLDHGPQHPIWIGHTRLSKRQLRERPDLRPIRVAAGSLGSNQPERDLYVSPQHRLLVRFDLAEQRRDDDEFLVAAKKLLGKEGIEVDQRQQSVDYYHLLFDAHEIVLSNGAPSESLFTGEQAFAAVGPNGRSSLLRHFPKILSGDHLPKLARSELKGRKLRELLATGARPEASH